MGAPHKKKPPPGEGEGFRKSKTDRLTKPNNYSPKRPSASALRASADFHSPLESLQAKTIARKCAVSDDSARTIAQLAFLGWAE
jgi:hypothetical protein